MGVAHHIACKPSIIRPSLVHQLPIPSTPTPPFQYPSLTIHRRASGQDVSQTILHAPRTDVFLLLPRKKIASTSRQASPFKKKSSGHGMQCARAHLLTVPVNITSHTHLHMHTTYPQRHESVAKQLKWRSAPFLTLSRAVQRRMQCSNTRTNQAFSRI